MAPHYNRKNLTQNNLSQQEEDCKGKTYLNILERKIVELYYLFLILYDYNSFQKDKNKILAATESPFLLQIKNAGCFPHV